MKAYRPQPKDLLHPVCISCTPPANDANLICHTSHWKIILHPNQCSIGNTLIVSLRHVPRVSELTEQEALDFYHAWRIYEPALQRCFGTDLLNLACDRNFAFRAVNPEPPLNNGRPNPHVHWHVAARYSSGFSFMGLNWSDPNFGAPFVWRKMEVPTEVRSAIIAKIRSELPVTYDV